MTLQFCLINDTDGDGNIDVNEFIVWLIINHKNLLDEKNNLVSSTEL